MEPARVQAGAAKNEDGPLDITGRGDLADGPREIGDRGGIATIEVERIDPGGLEPEDGPAGHPGTRLLAGCESEAAVLVLRGPQPGDGLAGTRGLRLRRRAGILVRCHANSKRRR